MHFVWMCASIYWIWFLGYLKQNSEKMAKMKRPIIRITKSADDSDLPGNLYYLLRNESLQEKGSPSFERRGSVGPNLSFRKKLILGL